MAQSLPSSARSYARARRAEIRAALVASRRLWRQMGPDFDASYAGLEVSLLTAVYTAQGRVAERAGEYVPRVMGQTGFGDVEPDYVVPHEAWVGTAGDGRDVPGLAYGAVTTAKRAVAAGYPESLALASGGAFLTKAVGTLLSDTARGAEQVGAKASRVGTFVRVLSPPSCGRCVILAGQTYGSSTAFDRHPGCDCYNIPAPENVAGDMVSDPHEYLDHLSDDELARTLGSKANAQAWRDGADVNQLVNAYRRGGDVRKAQVYGRSVKVTTEGTTRRGWAYHSMAQADYLRAAGERRAGRYMRAKAPRLMPASIYEVATDPADVQRLLRLYGWL